MRQHCCWGCWYDVVLATEEGNWWRNKRIFSLSLSIRCKRTLLVFHNLCLSTCSPTRIRHLPTPSIDIFHKFERKIILPATKTFGLSHLTRGLHVYCLVFRAFDLKQLRMNVFPSSVRFLFSHFFFVLLSFSPNLFRFPPPPTPVLLPVPRCCTFQILILNRMLERVPDENPLLYLLHDL